MKRTVFLLCLLAAICTPQAQADYAHDENVRRAAQQMHDISEAERENAKRAYDAEHSNDSGGNFIGGLIIVMFLGCMALMTMNNLKGTKP